MNKKICVVLLSIILLVCFWGFSFSRKNVYAADGSEFELGVTNLNNTSENSAIVGDKLALPEKGWKRYEDNNKNIEYTNGFVDGLSNGYYNENAYKNYGHQVLNNTDIEYARFNFTGSKIRLISVVHTTYPEWAYIKVDGIEYKYNIRDNSTKFTVLVFELKDLNYGEHSVEIYQKDKSNVGLVVDAIDIDESGELSIYNGTKAESISIDKPEMDLYVDSSEKVIATIVPESSKDKKVLWSSSDEAIATVDKDGNVYGNSIGQAIITAQLEGTELIATCKVRVIAKEQTEPQDGNAILSISLVDGSLREYDLDMNEVIKFIDWYNKNESTTFKFKKKINPYKSVEEYLVYDKIISFIVQEY